MWKKYHKLKDNLNYLLSGWIILSLLLYLAFLTYTFLNNSIEKNARSKFDFRSQEIIEAIAERMNVYEGLLSGGVALFNASNNVERNEWKHFVETLDVNKHWPGVQALGYAVPVMPEDLNEHISKVRAEGFSDFNLRPRGERDYYTSIIYIEPFDWRNKSTFGYDMWSNEIQREAMDRARNTGFPATSGVITLVQETDENIQKGFFTYFPVYKKNLPLNSFEERQNALEGWVYSAYRINDLMEGILGFQDSKINIEIYDNKEISDDSLLFDSNDISFSEKVEKVPEFETVKTIKFQGHPWTIYISSEEAFIPSQDKKLSIFITLTLILIALLLFYIFYSMYHLRERATKIADEMTVEVKRKVLELERSNKDLEQFAYVASHDLQEPVRKMVSFSQLFESKYEDIVDEKGKKYIDFIVDGAKRMQRLIQDLLEYSRVGKGDWQLEETPLNLAVEEALDNLQYTVEKNNAKINYSELPTLSVNKTSIVQLFQNLIGNSIKYRSKEDPVIEITAESDTAFHEISVQDNGIGIDQKYLENIFTIFERLHNSKDYKGTGIGLAICKRIIEQHEGKIWAESDGINGTTFKFTLPA